jgi:hypothetical protein
MGMSRQLSTEHNLSKASDMVYSGSPVLTAAMMHLSLTMPTVKLRNPIR